MGTHGVKHLLRSLIRRAAATRIGWKLIEAATMPEVSDRHFGAVQQWPQALRGFDDLVFLFNITGLNKGLISQNLDEAAHLYRVASELPAGATIVEVGRFKGGSTLLIAAAMPAGAELHSYDLHVELPPGFTAEAIDAGIRAALERYGLGENVTLHVADSRSVELPAAGVDLLFLDGDHSYEGVRADFEHWLPALRPGASLFFHDAAPPTGYPALHASPGVAQFVGELGRRSEVEWRTRAGSIVQFTRARY